MQGEALASTVCCGLRELQCDSEQMCPPDSAFVPGGILALSQCREGTFPCGLVPGMFNSGIGRFFVPDMPCDEFSKLCGPPQQLLHLGKRSHTCEE